MKAPTGALVAKIEPDSAAAQAGLKVGDVILEFNGNPIIDAGQLSARVGAAAPGDKASLQVWRNGKATTLTVTIGSATPVEVAGTAGANASSQAQLGLALRPLNAEERQQAGVSGGLVVEDVQGRAAEAGIQPGDVVLSVDGTPVQSVAQLRKMVQEHDKQMALLIQRGENRLFIPVTLG
jgi:serine protease Do